MQQGLVGLSSGSLIDIRVSPRKDKSKLLRPAAENTFLLNQKIDYLTQKEGALRNYKYLLHTYNYKH